MNKRFLGFSRPDFPGFEDAPVDNSYYLRRNGVWILASYLNLLDKPKAETNANDVFSCSTPGGNSTFIGTIATLPGGATLTYNVTSGNEGAMVPTSTSQLANMRLYNTTRGTYALISNCVTGTNTLTFKANVPAGWQVGDTITIASQTVSGGVGGWVDLEITSGFVNRIDVDLVLLLNNPVSGNVFLLHPLETFSSSKQAGPTAIANETIALEHRSKITSNVFSVAWTGSPAYVYIREAGYTE